MVATCFFIALSGPNLPFHHVAAKFGPAVIPHVGNIGNSTTAVDTWRDIVLSEDGAVAVYAGNRYRWTDLPDGDWSNEEAVYLDHTEKPETYTTSQAAHLPRSANRQLVAGQRAIAAFHDHSLLVLVMPDPQHDMYAFASLIHFDARGQRPNPVFKLRWGLGNDFLARQAEDPNRIGLLDLQRRGENVRVRPISFRRTGVGAAATYAVPVDIPCLGRAQSSRSPREWTSRGEVLPPFAIDIASGMGLYAAYRSSPPKDILGFHEYLIGSQRWRDVATPPGFGRYGMPGDGEGIFYWRGRLLCSPQHPAGDAQAVGLFEASRDRKSWKKIANCSVIGLSPSKGIWLVRDSRDDSVWIEKMR